MGVFYLPYQCFGRQIGSENEKRMNDVILFWHFWLAVADNKNNDNTNPFISQVSPSQKQI